MDVSKASDVTTGSQSPAIVGPRGVDSVAVEFRRLSATPQWQAYLDREAAKRGITPAQMHELELQALKDIEELGITDEFLNFVKSVAQPAQKTAAQQP